MGAGGRVDPDRRPRPHHQLHDVGAAASREALRPRSGSDDRAEAEADARGVPRVAGRYREAQGAAEGRRYLGARKTGDLRRSAATSPSSASRTAARAPSCTATDRASQAAEVNLPKTAQGERLDRAVHALLAAAGRDVSMREIRRAIDEGLILIAGKKRAPGERASGGESVDV